MRKPIGIFGATDEALQLIPLLAANPHVEIAGVFDANAAALRESLHRLDPEVAATLEARLTDDPSAFADPARLYAVVDAEPEPGFTARFPQAAERGIQIVTPLLARLLWGYGVPSGDRKAELLQALHEVLDSYSFTIDADELFRRMLEIAIGVTGAEGGSVMLLDAEAGELSVRVAVGVEPELWPKIRVPIGDGIAGRVAAEARPLRLRGKADRQSFQIVRERLDVESALCVPLVHSGRVLGVLNLHHSTRPEAFSEADLEFTEQLAHLDAQIIARAQEHESLRSQAGRYAAVRKVHEILAGKAPLAERLTKFCHFISERTGRGIATIYLYDPDGDDLHLTATSLEGGGFGGEYRVAIGQGIDGTVASTRQPSFLRAVNGTLAYAALPLLVGDSLAGVLTLQAGSEATRGRAIEENLLEIAAAAAEEIATATREAHMAARANQANAINEAGIRMISATDPAEVLRLGTSGAAMVLEADHAILRLQDAETGRYVIRSYFGSADGHEQEKLFRLDKRVSVDVIKRRGSLLVREIAQDETLGEFDGGVCSVIAAPLKREGRVIGTISIYDKVATDRFTTGSFGQADLQLFTKFVSYLERAVANALFYAHARQFRNFDEDTGLPNANYIGKRIHEEIIRAGNNESGLAVAVCRIENLVEIEQSINAARSKKVAQRTVDALRAHLRDFDVLGRTDENEFTVLMPEPGFAAGERVFALARAVADDVSKDDSLNDPIRVALGFGYAVFPSEGTDRESLIERAKIPRIQMV
ncbi:MAG: GAF domain-containing protein [Myxococcales bacterium]|nr:GAF domain-containing protein [Myxococcales bacterium]